MNGFRQVILPGDVGEDVLVVKRALRRMGIEGSGAMSTSSLAGPAFVEAVRAVQRLHSITVDGKYGKDTHAFVAPHFTAADAVIYARAVIRPRDLLGPVPADSVAAAKRLLQLAELGKYHADNPGDMNDVEATAAGRAVPSKHGGLVHLDPRVLQVILHLIDRGHTIGTFALCSDHHDDGLHGHAGGRAVDISTVDGKAVSSPASRPAVLAVDMELRQAGPLTPRQLITGGCGNARDPEIEALCIPSPTFFGVPTILDHTNHIHVGY
jgi:hypothetical protein